MEQTNRVPVKDLKVGDQIVFPSNDLVGVKHVLQTQCVKGNKIQLTLRHILKNYGRNATFTKLVSPDDLVELISSSD